MAAKKLCTLTVISRISFRSSGASSRAILTFSRGADKPLNIMEPWEALNVALLFPSLALDRSPPDSLALTRGEVGVERVT